MIARSLAQALMGVCGVWLIVKAVPQLAILIPMLAAPELGPEPIFEGPLFQVIMPAAYIGLHVASGAVLLALRRPLATWLVPEQSADDPQIPALEPLAFAVLGVLLVVDGTSGLISSLLATGVALDSRSAPAVADALKAVVGLGLFVGARGVATIWTNARSASRIRSAAQQADEPDVE